MPAREIDLSGEWRLADEGGIAIPMRLPGDAVSALAAAGIVPEPYEGANADHLGWIAARDWTLSRHVTLDDPEVELVVGQLDTVAEIRVNGTPVLGADSMFRTHRADLSGVAVPGENLIEIAFPAAPAVAARRSRAQPWFVPWHRGNCRIPSINMLRKQQCDFGWDWNPALAPFGVYGEIVLRPRGAPRIRHVATHQEHAAGRVTVFVTAETAHAPDGAEVAISLGGAETRATVTGGKAGAAMVIDAPELWWPAGQGEQPLYELELRLGEAVERRRIGLRDIRLQTEPGAEGTGFRFSVNGRDVFAKGANWVPADALAGRITREGVEDLLRSAVDAHMNMIRVWGGGRYEPGWFYDLCDEMGLMVWQDFMFACNLYPATESFLDSVRAEAREQVRRLHHHASIALWCGDNEIVGMLNEFPEARANRDRYLVAYDRLNRTLETALRSELPDANWWPSSPSHGPLDFGDAWHEDGRGDMHVWTVWHEGRDFSAYREVAPRFVSEFGFQSFPSPGVIRGFAAPEDRNIASPVMEAHQRAPGGTARIAETLMREFRFPTGFDDFVYLSQVQQGLALCTAIEHWRGLRPHCMGTLYWQLNDSWPGISWSTLDHGGGWKLSHHMVRRAYAPVIATAVPEQSGWRIRMVNDSPRVARGKLQVSAVAADGAVRSLSQPWFELRGGSAQGIAALEAEAMEPGEVLVLDWPDPDERPMRAVAIGGRWKDIPLRDPEIEMRTEAEGGAVAITLRAGALAPFVALQADRPGRFSDNVLTLLPGEPVSVTFVPDAPGAAPGITFRELHGATHGGTQ